MEAVERKKIKRNLTEELFKAWYETKKCLEQHHNSKLMIECIKDDIRLLEVAYAK